MKRFADCARILQGKRPFAPKMPAYSQWRVDLVDGCSFEVELHGRIVFGHVVPVEMAENAIALAASALRPFEQLTRELAKSRNLRGISLVSSHAREADPAG